MSKTINKIVWEVFIEQTMGQAKSELYTDRIKDYLQNFQDLPDIRAAAEKVDDEDKLASVWT